MKYIIEFKEINTFRIEITVPDAAAARAALVREYTENPEFRADHIAQELGPVEIVEEV